MIVALFGLVALSLAADPAPSKAPSDLQTESSAFYGYSPYGVGYGYGGLGGPGYYGGYGGKLTLIRFRAIT